MTTTPSREEESVAAIKEEPAPEATPQDATANDDNDDKPPQVSTLTRRLLSCFSYFFNNCHLSRDTSQTHDYRDTTTQTYDYRDDLSFLIGDDYDDIIGNAIKEKRRMRSDPLILEDDDYDYGYDDDDNGPIFFSTTTATTTTTE